MATVQLQCPRCRAAFAAEVNGAGHGQCPACREMVAVSVATAAERWFFAQNRKKIGPLSLAQLLELSVTGQLQPNDMVCAEGSPRWVQAASVPGLFDAPEDQAPTINDGVAAVPVQPPPEPTMNGPILREPDAGATHQPAAEPPGLCATGIFRADDDLFGADTAGPPGGQPAAKPVPFPTVSGYDILGVLGRGGMGVVYKARQRKLQRLVALKMILGGAHASDEDLARFRIEGEAVARLQHPNIVQIYEVGDHDGLPFFSLEYVEGGSLEDKLNAAPIANRQGAAIVETLARAMHAAHEHGIIHRDLKPANVLLSAAGQPKITDFGLAKKLDQVGGQTRTGDAMGTPSYMAPEQAFGNLKQIGPASDTYALGAILYELMTNRPPFHGETALDTMVQVMSQEAVPASRLQPKVPRDLNTICMKCLEKEPRKRYASALELAEDLRRFLANEPIQARPVSVGEQLVKFAKRRPGIAALTALSLALLLWGIAGITWQWRKAEIARGDAVQKASEAITARHDAVQKADEAIAARKEEEKQRQRAEQTLYYNRLSLASHEWWASNVGRTRQLLDECSPEQRQWEWHYLKRLSDADLFTFRGHTGWVTGISYSKDGSKIATCELNRKAIIWDAATGRILATFTGHKEAVNAIALSADARTAATASDDHTVKVWDAESGTLRRSLPCPHMAKAVAFSADGSRLVVGIYDHSVKVFEASTGKELLTLREQTGPVTSVAISPDGKQVAATAEGSPLRVWDANTGQLLHSLQALTCVAYSPDSQYLAALHDRAFKVFDAATGKAPVTTTVNTGLNLSAVAYSRDGQRLAVGSQDGTIHLIGVGSTRALTLRGHTNRILGVSFSPDDQRLASASSDRTAKIWDTQRTQEALTLRHVSPGYVSMVAASPDGEHVASAGSDGFIKVWNTRTGKDVATLLGHKGIVTCVAFSRDGKRLASGSKDKTVKIWEPFTGNLLNSFDGYTGDILGIAFSPDGRQLATTASLGVLIKDVDSGKTLRNLTGHTYWTTAVAYSPDGTRIASAAADLTVRLWDPATGKQVQVLTGHPGAVYSVVFDATGRRLASSDGEGTVKIWDLSSSSPQGTEQTLGGGTGAIRGIAFSADGKRFFSITSDLIKIWDLTTGREVMSLRGHNGLVMSLAYLGNSQRLASGSTDGTVKIWDGTPVGK